MDNPRNGNGGLATSRPVFVWNDLERSRSEDAFLEGTRQDPLEFHRSAFSAQPVENKLGGLTDSYAFLSFPLRQYEATERSALHLERSFSPGRLTGPIRFFVELCDEWELSQLECLILLGFEGLGDIDQYERLVSGMATLRGRDLKDRIAILLSIQSTLSGWLPDEKDIRTWLRTESDELENASPVDVMCRGSIADLLHIQHFADYCADGHP